MGFLGTGHFSLADTFHEFAGPAAARQQYSGMDGLVAMVIGGMGLLD